MYSLGMVIIEIFTREMPFLEKVVGGNFRKLLKTIIESGRPPNVNLPDIDPEIMDIIRGLVRTSPKLVTQEVLEGLSNQAEEGAGLSDLNHKTIKSIGLSMPICLTSIILKFTRR